MPLRCALRDQRGLATVEYTIVLVLLAALAVGAWSQFGGAIEKNASHAHTTIRDYLTPDSKGTD